MSSKNNVKRTDKVKMAAKLPRGLETARQIINQNNYNCQLLDSVLYVDLRGASMEFDRHCGKAADESPVNVEAPRKNLRSSSKTTTEKASPSKIGKASTSKSKSIESSAPSPKRSKRISVPSAETLESENLVVEKVGDKTILKRRQGRPKATARTAIRPKQPSRAKSTEKTPPSCEEGIVFVVEDAEQTLSTDGNETSQKRSSGRLSAKAASNATPKKIPLQFNIKTNEQTEDTNEEAKTPEKGKGHTKKTRKSAKSPSKMTIVIQDADTDSEIDIEKVEQRESSINKADETEKSGSETKEISSDDDFPPPAPQDVDLDEVFNKLCLKRKADSPSEETAKKSRVDSPENENEEKNEEEEAETAKEANSERVIPMKRIPPRQSKKPETVLPSIDLSDSTSTESTEKAAEDKKTDESAAADDEQPEEAVQQTENETVSDETECTVSDPSAGEEEVTTNGQTSREDEEVVDELSSDEVCQPKTALSPDLFNILSDANDEEKDVDAVHDAGADAAPPSDVEGKSAAASHACNTDVKTADPPVLSQDKENRINEPNVAKAKTKAKRKNPFKIRFRNFTAHECKRCGQTFEKNVELQVHILRHYDKRRLVVRLFNAKTMPNRFVTTQANIERYLRPQSADITDIDAVKSLLGKYVDSEQLKPFDTYLPGDVSTSSSSSTPIVHDQEAAGDITEKETENEEVEMEVDALELTQDNENESETSPSNLQTQIGAENESNVEQENEVNENTSQNDVIDEEKTDEAGKEVEESSQHIDSEETNIQIDEAVEDVLILRAIEKELMQDMETSDIDEPDSQKEAEPMNEPQTAEPHREEDVGDDESCEKVVESEEKNDMLVVDKVVSLEDDQKEAAEDEDDSDDEQSSTASTCVEVGSLDGNFISSGSSRAKRGIISSEVIELISDDEDSTADRSQLKKEAENVENSTNSKKREKKTVNANARGGIIDLSTESDDEQARAKSVKKVDDSDSVDYHSASEEIGLSENSSKRTFDKVDSEATENSAKKARLDDCADDDDNNLDLCGSQLSR